MELLTEDGTTVQCEVVLVADWRTNVARLIAGRGELPAQPGSVE